MGGGRDYAIVPDSQGCPTLNQVMISGTEYAHIYQLEKMR